MDFLLAFFVVFIFFFLSNTIPLRSSLGEEIPQMLVTSYTSTDCPFTTSIFCYSKVGKKIIRLKFCFRSLCSTQKLVFIKEQLEEFCCSV